MIKGFDFNSIRDHVKKTHNKSMRIDYYYGNSWIPFLTLRMNDITFAHVHENINERLLNVIVMGDMNFRISR